MTDILRQTETGENKGIMKEDSAARMQRYISNKKSLIS